MKFLLIADIDDFHWNHGEGKADLLLSCGDVSDQVIMEAAKAYDSSLILAVKGNHDTNARFPAPIVDLHLRSYEHNCIRFGGFNGSWRYKPRGNFLYDQGEAQELLSDFPPANVFLSHNSPRRIHDREDEVHYGFDALNVYIQRVKPRFVIHGHQHTDKETMIGETKVIGVYGHKLIEV